MMRLTTDAPNDNLFAALNLFYDKDGETWVRGGGEAPDYPDVSLNEYLSCAMTDFVMDGPGYIEGLIATLYTAAWAFSELRAKLKDYEDTGLEPGAVAVLAPLFTLEDAYDVTLERLIQLAKADHADLLVVLPCIKKYKTMYWLWGDMIMPVRYWGIHGGTVTKDRKYHVSCEMRTKKDRIFDKNRRHPYTVRAGDRRFFYADDIGKTVFLTRGAAEAALAERERGRNQ